MIYNTTPNLNFDENFNEKYLYLKIATAIYRQSEPYTKFYHHLSEDEIYSSSFPLLKNDLIRFIGIYYLINDRKFYQVTAYTQSKELSPDGNPIDCFIIDPNLEDYAIEADNTKPDFSETVFKLCDEIIENNLKSYHKINKAATYIMNKLWKVVNFNIPTTREQALEFHNKKELVDSIIYIAYIIELHDLMSNLRDTNSIFTNEDLFNNLKSEIPSNIYQDWDAHRMIFDRIGLFYKESGLTNRTSFFLVTDFAYNKDYEIWLVDHLNLRVNYSKTLLDKSTKFLNKIYGYGNVFVTPNEDSVATELKKNDYQEDIDTLNDNYDNQEITPTDINTNDEVNQPQVIHEELEPDQGVVYSENETGPGSKKSISIIPIVLGALAIFKIFK